MVCSGTICHELLLHRNGRASVLLSNKMHSLCNKRSGLCWYCFKTTWFTAGLTCKQTKAAALVVKSFFRCVSKAADGLPLLTVSAKLFSFPMMCIMSALIPRCFCAMVDSFVNFLANLLELENLVAQQFADVLSPPMCRSGCQFNCTWPFSSAVVAAKILTMIAANSSSSIQSLWGWVFGRSLILWCIYGHQVFQQTCHQYWSRPEPPPIPHLVEESCWMLASGTRSTKWLNGLIHLLVPFRCLMHCPWR